MTSSDNAIVATKQSIPIYLKFYFLSLLFAFRLMPRVVISDFAVAIMLMVAVYNIFKKNTLQLIVPDALFIMFSGITLIGVNISSNLTLYLKEIIIVVFLYLSLRMLSSILSSKEKIEESLKYLSISFITLTIFLAIVVLTNQIGFTNFSSYFLPVGERLSWPFQFPNQLGIALTVLLPLAIYKINSTLVRNIVYSCFIVAITSTGSRSCFIVSFFEIIAIELLSVQLDNIFKLIKKFTALLIMITAIFATMYSSFAFNRSLGLIKKTSFFSDKPRITELRLAMDTASSFLQGYGLGCFKKYNPHEIHNTAVSIFVETGIFGFGIFTILLSLLIKPLLIHINNCSCQGTDLRKFLIISLIAILILSFVFNLTRTRAIWTIIAICFSYHNLNNKLPERK